MSQSDTIRNLIHDTIDDYRDEIGGAAYDGLVDRLERKLIDLLQQPDKGVYGDLAQYAAYLDKIDSAILHGQLSPYTLAEYGLLDELRRQVRGQMRDVSRLLGELEGIGSWIAWRRDDDGLARMYSARVISDLAKRIDETKGK